MLFQYRSTAKRSFKAALLATDDGKYLRDLLGKSKKIGDTSTTPDLGAKQDDWPRLAAAVGLQAVGRAEIETFNQDSSFFQQALKKYGPLWCAGSFFQGGEKGGHVILVTGTLIRKFLGKPKDCIIFHDPAPKALQGEDESVKQYKEWFLKNLYSFEDTLGQSPIMYLQ
jgi:hypothetical protein